MTLLANWKEGQREILGAKAFIEIPNYKEQTFTCIDPDCNQTLSLKKEHNRFTFGKLIWVIPHFVHPPTSACKLAGESAEHYERKLVLLSYLYCNKIKINIHGLVLVIDPENILGPEKRREENIADVLLEFKEYNPLFGNGIVFEIMVSETEESIETKKKKWLTKGYTVIPIPRHLSYDELALKGIKIEATFLKSLLNNLESQEDRLRELFKNVDSPVNQIVQNTESQFNCSNCLHSSEDKTREGTKTGLMSCWKFKKYNYNNRPNKYTPNQVCNFWEHQTGGKRI